MSWKLIGTPKTQRITKKLAEQFMNMEPAPDDRPLSEQRLRVYEKVAKDGGFRPVAWASAYCEETGGTYRVNGKHTSTLFSRMDPLPELYAVSEVYKCDTLQDVARLYSTFDSKMQSRSVADINRSFASCVPQLADVPANYVNLSASAIWYSRVQGEYTKIQPVERAEVLLEHWDFIVWVAKMFGRSGNGGRAKNRHIVRMPVFAAAFATWVKHPVKGMEFWTLVRDETAPSPDDPTRKLSRFLLTSGMLRSDRPSKKFRVPEKAFFVKCLRAWNAWMLGEPTDLRFSPKEPVPSVK